MVCPQATQTSANYRLYALPDGKRPGLIRDENNGSTIDVEVWEMPIKNFGSFVAQIPAPLGIGSLELNDKTWVKGFICEAFIIEQANEITNLGGWKPYITINSSGQS